MKEVLTIGKVCWEVREAIEGRAEWDLVVVDAAATGHVISQLGAPEAIRELVAVGPVRSQTEWMSEILNDPALTALNVVATPEEMPVEETIDLVGRAREELEVDARRCHREPRAAGAVHPRRRGRVRRAARTAGDRDPHRACRPGRHRGPGRRAPRGLAAPHAAPRTSPGCATRWTSRCSTSRTCSRGPTASARPRMVAEALSQELGL